MTGRKEEVKGDRKQKIESKRKREGMDKGSRRVGEQRAVRTEIRRETGSGASNCAKETETRKTGVNETERKVIVEERVEGTGGRG